ncbi:TonB-dependent receptor [Flavobacterium ajazii]|uniref:TonB-dependent receptor n=1 Tax=Flavobacterium ajazii TaxID=2692318 RepID=UPI001FE51F9F|nr:TonB-dependent receptor [Flavobacterium ajazii]
MNDMIKTLSFIVFSLCCFSSLAQKSIALNGKIVTEKEAPIEAVTVYLIHPKDSSVINYTLSDKNGHFKLETKAISQNIILKVSGEGYQEFSETIEKLTQNMDLGVIKLLKHENELNEVIVKSEAPVRVKKDTVEFNASSFKMRPDANVEALLRQLPGVTIDADKKIMVNGKEVNQILVNGKPFFGEDGKVALQNLPAEIIKKIQVSDTKTKEQEFTKQASTSNNASINLTIEKDKNKGFFGKVLGGYGSSERYESSALMSYFKDKKRISFLASSNNINATGFSMDEVFDNMGGGRNPGSRGPVIGRGPGIIKSNMIGLNYADEWFKGANSNVNYYFTNSNSENNNTTTEATLLPTGSLLAVSNSKDTRDFNKHNADLNFEYNISPATKIIVTPKIEIGRTTSISDFDKKTWNENNQLINTSGSYNTNETDNSNFQNNIFVFTKGKRIGRYFTANFQNENSRNDSDSKINSLTVFTDGSSPDDERIQDVIQNTDRDKYSSAIQYTEPVSDSVSLNFKIVSDFEKTIDDKKTFDRNGGNDDYNDLYSNYSSSNRFQISPKVGFSINKKKFNLTVSTGTYLVKTQNHALYLNETTDLNKNYVIPEGTIQTNYRFTKSKGIFMIYDRRFTIPKDYQVLAVANLDNPLVVRTGNPDLKASTSHFLYLTFSDYDFQSRSGYYIYTNSTYYDNQIVGASAYNASGKQISTYDNVYGTYNTIVGGEWSKSIKKDAHTYGLRFNLSTTYNYDKGFTNGELYSAKSLRFMPGMRFSYDYGELLSIKPSYNFTYNDTRYSNSSISSTSNTTHNFNVEMTTLWPKNWVLGNDFGYSYNSNISGPYKKDFYLWNTSLSYKFAEDKFTFKVKVYDILNQNQSTSRTITPTSVVDSENTVLKRYVMFSLLYKFQNFEIKKKN